MPKRGLGINVLQAAQERIEWTFDNFDRIYCSFSAGKDSGVMVHMVCEEAKKRGRKIGLFFLDWEAQFSLTIDFAEQIYKEYADHIEPYWVAVPIKTWNACSTHEPEWTAWDESKKNLWARPKSEISIKDGAYFPFWYEGIMFEEFVPTFGQWYAQGEKCACFVGIRAQESLNRFRSISRKKPTYEGKMFTTNVVENVWNVYPIYDWKVEDIWTFHAKTGKSHNKLYDRMHQAGMKLSQMRICEPMGDESRKGLWLYQVVEPSLWAKQSPIRWPCNPLRAMRQGRNGPQSGKPDDCCPESRKGDLCNRLATRQKRQIAKGGLLIGRPRRRTEKAENFPTRTQPQRVFAEAGAIERLYC